MTVKRNILTVDGVKVAVVDFRGVVLKHTINQWKKKFAEENNIGYGGIGCVFQKPEEGLVKWKP